MAELEDIREQLGAFAGKFAPSTIVPGIVQAVNEDETIAVLFGDGHIIDDIRLKSIVKDGDQFVIRPRKNSPVLIGKIGNSEEYILIAASEIDEVEVKIGNTKLSISDKIELKAGGEDLLILLKDLIDAIINEKHMTNMGPTISLIADSELAYKNLKTRFEKILKSN